MLTKRNITKNRVKLTDFGEIGWLWPEVVDFLNQGYRLLSAR